MTWSPPPSPGPGNAPSRPSGHAAARTGPSGHWPPRPGSGPHAPGPPRSPPGDGPSSAIREYWSRCGSPRRGDESEQKTGSPNSPGMIDDFRLWGVKQMPSDGPPPFRRGGGWRSNMAAILLRTTPLSQRAEPSPLWYGTFPKHRIRRGTTGISLVRYGKAKRGCASRVPRSLGVTARRTRGVLVVRATPPFWPLVRHGGGQRWRPRWRPFAPRAGRSLSPQ